MNCSSPSLMGENWRFRRTGYCWGSFGIVVVITRAAIVADDFSDLQWGKASLLVRFRRLALASTTHERESGKSENCDSKQPEAGLAVGGIGKFDQIHQPADQQRHTGHDGIAERRAEGDHQEQDASPSNCFARPCMFDGEKEVEQDRTDADQNDDNVKTTGRAEKVPGKRDALP